MSNLKMKTFDALKSAFPNRGKLAVLLGSRFDVAYDMLTPQDALDVEYWTIVGQVAAEGWLSDLARAAYETMPGNAKLGALVVEFGLTSIVATVQPMAAGAPALATAQLGPALERMVRDRSGLSDLPMFLTRLAALEGRVCRIETQGLKALGTGFLVGPDLVMTNHHVVADRRHAAPDAGLVCRFDYLIGSDGVEVRAGRTVALADDWWVWAEPHDPWDVDLAATGLPAATALDFALLRLAEPVGDAARQGALAPDNPARGWIGIDRNLRLDGEDDIFILQHPEGDPLKLGIGRITEVVAGGLRLRHDVTTEPGSSGSPVLDSQLRLTALHHVGDPNAFRNALWNQAVPMARIIDFLDGKVDPFWEADAR